MGVVGEAGLSVSAHIQVRRLRLGRKGGCTHAVLWRCGVPSTLGLSGRLSWRPGPSWTVGLVFGAVEEEEGAAPCPTQVSSPGAGFGNQAAGDSRLRWEVGGRRGEKCTGGRGWGPQGRTGQVEARASMFSRNHRSRVTVARGSALEMEFKRGRFRLSVFSDPPEVSDRVPALPSSASPGRLCLPRGTAHATVREQTDASY